jgi:serine/threonine-protein kinase
MRLNIHVAVKEMVPQPGLDPQTLAQLRQQFYQEAQVLARLDHPNLVRVTDYFEEWGNAYLVMNFVEGQSLADRIAARGPLPEAQVLDWARQLLDALAYCHAQGVVHRDIKPQNIIIRADGRPILVDFGLVKLWDPRDPRTRTVVRAMGTPEYAPPEQWGAGHTDPRSDLYSLGATLYHALTGQAPATATDRTADPRILAPPRSINPSLRPETERAILRAMELAKDARWGSAAEMAAALSASAAAPAPVAKPSPAVPPSPAPRVMPGTPPPTAPARPRVPVWVWVGGGLVLLLIALGGLWVLGQMQRIIPITVAGSVSTPPLIPPTAMPSPLPPTATPTPVPKGFCDFFDNPIVDPRWEWIDPLGGSKVYVENKGLIIETVGGKRDIYGENLNAPRLLQTFSAEDFSYQTLVTIRPDFARDVMAFQGGGLILFRDAANYVWVAIGTSMPDIDSAFAVNGERNVLAWPEHRPLLENPSAYLRIERKNNQVSAAYSSDGKNWTESTPINFPSGEMQAGLVLFSAWDSPGFWAHFDSFLWEKCVERPSLKSATVEVFANKGWQNTGVELNENDQVTVEYVSGKWTNWIGHNQPHDGNGPPDVYICAQWMDANKCLEPIPTFPAGALVGRVGQQLIGIGNRATFIAESAGILELRMNDSDDGLYDNVGHIIVRITVHSP